MVWKRNIEKTFSRFHSFTALVLQYEALHFVRCQLWGSLASPGRGPVLGSLEMSITLLFLEVSVFQTSLCPFFSSNGASAVNLDSSSIKSLCSRFFLCPRSMGIFSINFRGYLLQRNPSTPIQFLKTNIPKIIAEIFFSNWGVCPYPWFLALFLCPDLNRPQSLYLKSSSRVVAFQWPNSSPLGEPWGWAFGNGSQGLCRKGQMDTFGFWSESGIYIYIYLYILIDDTWERNAICRFLQKFLNSP